MSKEIKFKLWSKIGKKFIETNNPNLEFVINNNGYLYSIENFYGEIYVLPQMDIEVLQYTDCTDSKGKMIFEGDILLSSNENGTFLQLIGFGDSEREYDCMLKGFKIIDGYTLENDDYEISECKSLTQELVEKNNIPIVERENIIMDGQWVIGNKHQNPELMELIKKRSE
nr:MAG TPA: YopX protein [Caudoviricetes sp.]